MPLDHPLLALGAALAAWFFATGAILWIDRRDRETWGASLLAATVMAGIASAVVIVTAGMTSAGAAYAAFVAAILLWGWHELSFLLGFVTGPRRIPCPPDAAGMRRFRLATATLIHHEIAIALTAVALVIATWGQPTQVAALAFLLLFGMRLSTKFNIFLGVPHFSDEMLPDHLAYLRSYFRTRRGNPLLGVSTVAAIALTAALVHWGAGLPAGSGARTQAMLLAALAGLGALEHLFLLLPVKDSALFTWMAPRRGPATISQGE
jgi:putative photosynthetic complex assembly protein 2